MELLDNNMIKKFFDMSEIRERFEGRHPKGCTLLIGNEMVKYPARFIVYCLSNMPISNVIFDGSRKEWTTINGNKRLRTIINFIDGKFSLEDGTFFNDLPGYLKFRLTSSITIESYFLTSGDHENREKIIKYIKEEV